jgi:hypothetical protein
MSNATGRAIEGHRASSCRVRINSHDFECLDVPAGFSPVGPELGPPAHRSSF